MAKPPRSIWVHPFDDPQFLVSITGSRPNVSDDDNHSVSDEHHSGVPSPASGSFNPDSKDTASQTKRDSSLLNVPGTSSSSSRPNSSTTPSYPTSATKDGKQKDRGFFGKLRDSAIGTKEERAAKKREKEKRREERNKRRHEEELRYIEARNRLIEERRKQYEAEAEAYRARGAVAPPYGSSYGNGSYGAPHPGAYGGPVYMPDYGYGQSPYGRRGGGFGGGGALLGGLVGGLLLGDLLF
jgi:hypothetical protein